MTIPELSRSGAVVVRPAFPSRRSEIYPATAYAQVDASAPDDTVTLSPSNVNMTSTTADVYSTKKLLLKFARPFQPESVAAVLLNFGVIDEAFISLTNPTFAPTGRARIDLRVIAILEQFALGEQTYNTLQALEQDALYEGSYAAARGGGSLAQTWLESSPLLPRNAILSMLSNATVTGRVYGLLLDARPVLSGVSAYTALSLQVKLTPFRYPPFVVVY